MKKSKLSRRITWRVIGIMSFFNVLIIGAIITFVFILSLGNGSVRGLYVTDGIAGNIETMLHVAKTATFNNRIEVEANIDSPEHIFDALEQILQVNYNLAGCFVALEPYYFNDKWFEAYVYHGDNMRIEHRQILTERVVFQIGQFSYPAPSVFGIDFGRYYFINVFQILLKPGSVFKQNPLRML